MGDVGDYWNDHRDYKRDKARAAALDMSVAEYHRWQARQRQHDKRAEKEARAKRHAANPYECPVCHRQFNTGGALKDHGKGTGHEVKDALRKIEEARQGIPPNGGWDGDWWVV